MVSLFDPGKHIISLQTDNSQTVNNINLRSIGFIHLGKTLKDAIVILGSGPAAYGTGFAVIQFYGHQNQLGELAIIGFPIGDDGLIHNLLIAQPHSATVVALVKQLVHTAVAVQPLTGVHVLGDDLGDLSGHRAFLKGQLTEFSVPLGQLREVAFLAGDLTATVNANGRGNALHVLQPFIGKRIDCGAANVVDAGAADHDTSLLTGHSVGAEGGAGDKIPLHHWQQYI